MSLTRGVLLGLLAAVVADAAAQAGLLTSTDEPDFEVETTLVPVIRTIFRTRPSSFLVNVKTTSAMVDGKPHAVLIPSDVPTGPALVGHDGGTTTNAVQTVTAWLADPTPGVTKSVSTSVSVGLTMTIPSVDNTNGLVPILSGTHSIGVTSLETPVPVMVQSAIATASSTPPNSLPAGSVPSTCSANEHEYNNLDKIVSGDNPYTVHCGQDNSQGSFALQYVALGGFDACPAACDRTPGCTGFTFVGAESGFCYLKSAEGTYSSAVPFITSAFKKTPTPADGPSSSSSSAASFTSTIGAASSSVPGTRSISSSSSLTSSAPSSTTTPAAGKSCSQIGKTYVDSKGQTYTVACNTDLPGNDLGDVQALSFSECLDECAKKDGCVAFSFLGGSGSGPCYLKNKAVPGSSNPNNADSAYLPSARQGTSSSPQAASTAQPSPSSQASSSLQVSQTSQAASSSSSSASGTTAPTATATGSCEALAKGEGPAKFTDQYGSLYNISCKHDIPGGNIKATMSPTFEGCFTKCDKTVNCVGFSFLNGYCYLKSSQENAISESPADVAAKVGTGPGIPSTLTESVSTQSATITVLQSSATSVVSTPSASAGASCKQLRPQVGLYKVTCGSDAQGGDLSLAQAGSFSACIPLCDTMPKCIGFAYVGGSGSGTCYFKQEHEHEEANSNVDIAFKPSAGAVSSSVSMPTGLPASTKSAPAVSTTSVSSGPTSSMTSASVSTLKNGGGIPSTTSPISSSSISSTSSPASIFPPTTTAAKSTTLVTITERTTTTQVPTTSSTKAETTTSSAQNPGGTIGGLPPLTIPILNPGWLTPFEPHFGGRCDHLLRKDTWKLVTEVVRGRRSLGHLYVESPHGNGLTAPIHVTDVRPAIVTRHIGKAAHFTWGQDGTLAMISNIHSGVFTDCIRPGLSLLQPSFSSPGFFQPDLGLGGVSWTVGWGSKFAAGDENGVSYDRLRMGDQSNTEHQFGGWRVCQGDHQLKWSSLDAPLDESRCAEVKLMQEMQ